MSEIQPKTVESYIDAYKRNEPIKKEIDRFIKNPDSKYTYTNGKYTPIKSDDVISQLGCCHTFKMSMSPSYREKTITAALGNMLTAQTSAKKVWDTTMEKTKLQEEQKKLTELESKLSGDLKVCQESLNKTQASILKNSQTVITSDAEYRKVFAAKGLVSPSALTLDLAKSIKEFEDAGLSQKELEIAYNLNDSWGESIRNINNLKKELLIAEKEANYLSRTSLINGKKEHFKDRFYSKETIEAKIANGEYTQEVGAEILADIEKRDVILPQTIADLKAKIVEAEKADQEIQNQLGVVNLEIKAKLPASYALTDDSFQLLGNEIRVVPDVGNFFAAKKEAIAVATKLEMEDKDLLKLRNTILAARAQIEADERVKNQTVAQIAALTDQLKATKADLAKLSPVSVK